MLIRIFQCPSGKDGWCFMDWDFARRHGFSLDDYDCVYEYEDEDENIDNRLLENIYEKFNVYHPHDYEGRSLSVSDIVSIDNSKYDAERFFYVDSFGYEEITDEI